MTCSMAGARPRAARARTCSTATAPVSLESTDASRGSRIASADDGSPPLSAAVAARTASADSAGRLAAAATYASRAVSHASFPSASAAKSIHACTTESVGASADSTTHPSRAERQRVSSDARMRRGASVTGTAAKTARTLSRSESGVGSMEKTAACSMYGIVWLASRQLLADGSQSPSAACICANSAARSRVPPNTCTAPRSTVSAAAARPASSRRRAYSRNGAASRGDTAIHWSNAPSASRSRRTPISVRSCTVRSIGSRGRRARSESTSGRIASLPPIIA
jgi:hypothetical protein